MPEINTILSILRNAERIKGGKLPIKAIMATTKPFCPVLRNETPSINNIKHTLLKVIK